MLVDGAGTTVEGGGFLEGMRELGELGFSTIWLSGGPLKRLEQLREVVEATRGVQIGSGIISVDRFDRAAVASRFWSRRTTPGGRGRCRVKKPR
jgi:hypothetical protein